jgi:hypothetical protein
VSTSAPRIAVYRAEHAKIARQVKLAAASKARFAALHSAEPAKSASDAHDAATVASSETVGTAVPDDATKVRRTVRARPKRSLALRQSNEERTALGYASPDSESFSYLGSNRPF